MLLLLAFLVTNVLSTNFVNVTIVPAQGNTTDFIWVNSELSRPVTVTVAPPLDWTITHVTLGAGAPCEVVDAFVRLNAERTAPVASGAVCRPLVAPTTSGVLDVFLVSNISSVQYVVPKAFHWVETRQCPPLTAPEHGSVYGSNLWGSHAKFRCDPGFSLSGPWQVYCNEGIWTTGPAAVGDANPILDASPVCGLSGAGAVDVDVPQFRELYLSAVRRGLVPATPVGPMARTEFSVMSDTIGLADFWAQARIFRALDICRSGVLESIELAALAENITLSGARSLLRAANYTSRRVLLESLGSSSGFVPSASFEALAAKLAIQGPQARWLWRQVGSPAATRLPVAQLELALGSAHLLALRRLVQDVSGGPASAFAEMDLDNDTRVVESEFLVWGLRRGMDTEVAGAFFHQLAPSFSETDIDNTPFFIYEALYRCCGKATPLAYRQWLASFFLSTQRSGGSNATVSGRCFGDDSRTAVVAADTDMDGTVALSEFQAFHGADGDLGLSEADVAILWQQYGSQLRVQDLEVAAGPELALGSLRSWILRTDKAAWDASLQALPRVGGRVQANDLIMWLCATVVVSKPMAALLISEFDLGGSGEVSETVLDCIAVESVQHLGAFRALLGNELANLKNLWNGLGVDQFAAIARNALISEADAKRFFDALSPEAGVLPELRIRTVFAATPVDLTFFRRSLLSAQSLDCQATFEMVAGGDNILTASDFAFFASTHLASIAEAQLWLQAFGMNLTFDDATFIGSIPSISSDSFYALCLKEINLIGARRLLRSLGMNSILKSASSDALRIQTQEQLRTMLVEWAFTDEETAARFASVLAPGGQISESLLATIAVPAPFVVQDPPLSLAAWRLLLAGSPLDPCVQSSTASNGTCMSLGFFVESAEAAVAIASKSFVSDDQWKRLAFEVALNDMERDHFWKILSMGLTTAPGGLIKTLLKPQLNLVSLRLVVLSHDVYGDGAEFAFHAADANSDGQVTQLELSQFVASLGCSTGLHPSLWDGLAGPGAPNNKTLDATNFEIFQKAWASPLTTVLTTRRLALGYVGAIEDTDASLPAFIEAFVGSNLELPETSSLKSILAAVGVRPSLASQIRPLLGPLSSPLTVPQLMALCAGPVPLITLRYWIQAGGQSATTIIAIVDSSRDGVVDEREWLSWGALELSLSARQARRLHRTIGAGRRLLREGDIGIITEPGEMISRRQFAKLARSVHPEGFGRGSWVAIAEAAGVWTGTDELPWSAVEKWGNALVGSSGNSIWASEVKSYASGTEGSISRIAFSVALDSFAGLKRANSSAVSGLPPRRVTDDERINFERFRAFLGASMGTSDFSVARDLADDLSRLHGIFPGKFGFPEVEVRHLYLLLGQETLLGFFMHTVVVHENSDAAFELVDSNGDDVIDLSEMKPYCYSIGIPPAGAREVLAKLGDAITVTHVEFQAMALAGESWRLRTEKIAERSGRLEVQHLKFFEDDDCRQELQCILPFGKAFPGSFAHFAFDGDVATSWRSDCSECANVPVVIGCHFGNAVEARCVEAQTSASRELSLRTREALSASSEPPRLLIEHEVNERWNRQRKEFLDKLKSSVVVERWTGSKFEAVATMLDFFPSPVDAPSPGPRQWRLRDTVVQKSSDSEDDMARFFTPLYLVVYACMFVLVCGCFGMLRVLWLWYDRYGRQSVYGKGESEHAKAPLPPPDEPIQWDYDEEMQEIEADLEADARALAILDLPKPEPVAPGGGSRGMPLTRLREIFEACDINGDGHISRIELIRGLRRDPAIAACFGLPAVVRQEDGTREQFEKVFQQIDRDSKNKLSLADFLEFAEANGLRTQEGASSLMKGWDTNRTRVCKAATLSYKDSATVAAPPSRPSAFSRIWKVARDRLGPRVQQPTGAAPATMLRIECYNSGRQLEREGKIEIIGTPLTTPRAGKDDAFAQAEKVREEAKERKRVKGLTMHEVQRNNAALHLQKEVDETHWGDTHILRHQKTDHESFQTSELDEDDLNHQLTSNTPREKNTFTLRTPRMTPRSDSMTPRQSESQENLEGNQYVSQSSVKSIQKGINEIEKGAAWLKSLLEKDDDDGPVGKSLSGKQIRPPHRDSDPVSVRDSVIRGTPPQTPRDGEGSARATPSQLKSSYPVPHRSHAGRRLAAAATAAARKDEGKSKEQEERTKAIEDSLESL